MMKNKIIIVLLLVSAGFGQDSQAMGGARNFAKKVFFSKTAAVAGALAVGNSVNFSIQNQKNLGKIKNGKITLSEKSQQEVKDFFAEHGYTKIEIRNSEVFMDSPSSPTAAIAIVNDGDQLYCLVGPIERFVFDQKDFCLELGAESIPMKYPDGIEPLTKDEVKIGIAHEVCHVKHSDILHRQLAVPFAGPAVLLAGKAMRVAGASKKLVVAGGLGLLYSLGFAQKKMARFQEERADRYAATTPENAKLMISYFKKIALPDELKEMKECQDQGITEEHARLAVLIKNRLASDHPLPSERIAYLEEIAGVKKTEETR